MRRPDVQRPDMRRQNPGAQRRMQNMNPGRSAFGQRQGAANRAPASVPKIDMNKRR